MAAKWDRRVMWGALGGAGALMVAAVTGRLNRRSGGLLVLREWLDRPLLFGMLVLALLFVALVSSRGKVWARSALGAVVVALAVGTVPLWLLSGVLSGDRRTTRDEAAPGRPDRRLVVQQDTAGFGPDPLFWVYLDEGTGLGTRRWDVAYVNGDADSIRELGWTAPDQLRLVTEQGTHLIRIAGNGRPDRTVEDRY
ncbi:hypothetical protein [Kitasatospora sp. A2-31]|uniref:hypothetical protein n=1 Tax=Kitasatospora sp. A2-31 TaxID=2916414 RepID=UPI001EE86B7D|nr:hypothetical protein [Kitasatospora sp. A2-31]MCG6492973.1 hypothetical protein [Kitasatospora sp. A2-31]